MIRTLNDEQRRQLTHLIIEYGHAAADFEQPDYLKELLGIPFSYDFVLDRLLGIVDFIYDLPVLPEQEVCHE